MKSREVLLSLQIVKVGTLVYLKHHGEAVSIATGGPRKWWTSSL
jgi:3D (Asp-Asp-Asp) domain-containing protein